MPSVAPVLRRTLFWHRAQQNQQGCDMPEAALRIAGSSNKKLARKVMLTKSIIDGLSVPPGRGDIHVYDLKIPGVAYRGPRNGHRAWYLVRRIHGRAHRLKLGGADLTVEQARTKA